MGDLPVVVGAAVPPEETLLPVAWLQEVTAVTESVQMNCNFLRSAEDRLIVDC